MFNLKTKRAYNDLLNLAFRTLQEDLGLANKITVVGAHAIYSNYFAGLIDLAVCMSLITLRFKTVLHCESMN